MRSKTNFAGRPDKFKLVAIPVLLIVLVWVIMPSKETSSDQQLSSTSVAPSKAATGNRAVSQSPKPKEQKIRRQWPELKLADVLVYDPFSNREHAKSKIFASQLSELSDRAPHSPQQREVPVSVYYETASTVSALAAGQRLRLGDVIDVNWQVTSITAQNVTLTQIGAAAAE